MIAATLGIALAVAAWQALTGTPKDKQNFIKANLGLAYTAARRVRPQGCEMSDCINTAVLGLCTAVDSFDPTRGTTFSTWAHWHMQKALLALFPKACVVKVPGEVFWQAVKLTKEDEPAMMLRPAVSMDAASVSDEGNGKTLHDTLASEDNPEDNAIEAWSLVVLVDLARKVLSGNRKPSWTAPRLSILAFRLAAPFLGYEAATLEEIGDMHDLTRERIRQIEVDVVESLQARL